MTPAVQWELTVFAKISLLHLPLNFFLQRFATFLQTPPTFLQIPCKFSLNPKP